MKKYPIKRVALTLAQFSVQEEASKKGRWITCEEDFTAEEREEVQKLEDAVVEILLASDGKPWQQTLTTVQAALCPSLFIGFRLQDAVIKACKQCGITPAPRAQISQ